jgi:ribosomal protein S18 acetylase RimI-like enzyme
MLYRKAVPADAPALRAIIEAAYFGEGGQTGWTHESWMLTGPRTSEADVRRLIDTAGYFLVAEQDGRPVACAVLDRDGADAHIAMFSILPSLQGTGIGRVFLAEAERVVVRLWGVRRMVLEVTSPRTELYEWYARRGYQPTGRRLPFPFEEEPSAPLVEGIELIEMDKPLGP